MAMQAMIFLLGLAGTILFTVTAEVTGSMGTATLWRYLRVTTTLTEGKMMTYSTLMIPVMEVLGEIRFMADLVLVTIVHLTGSF